MFRMIENKKANKPFFNEAIAVHIYTLEELCYFMETHVYMIDTNWINEDLFAWMDEELMAHKLVGELRQSRRMKEDVFTAAEIIFRSAGIYSPQDLSDLVSLLNTMRGKTKVERRKMSGDLALMDGRYRQAAYTYMELLKDEYARQMTEELRGNIYHNLGVIYARLFMFPEAAQLFMEAYTLRKEIKSRDAYLYAVNFLDDDSELDEQALDLNFNVMKDILNRLSEVSQDNKYYVERKRAVSA
ncbi:MAG: hypothetical protein LUC41_08555, partial [Clostridiales bacterium]|nr:hypothetical protein [Clostridiales bacterium]